MYEGKNLNWLSLFIKVVIFVLFVLLAIWLVTTIANKIGGNSFEENMNIMKEASINYFKEGNLPSEEGESKEVTLDELIKLKYITSFDKDCDREKSYSQATLVDDYYALRVELMCGSKKDYIYTSIDSDGNCVGDSCNGDAVEEKEEEKETETEESTNVESSESSNESTESQPSNTPATGNANSSNNNSNNNNNNNNNSNDNKKLYYEHVKINKVYGNWQYEKISGNNVETKNVNTILNTYCKLNIKDYYVVAAKPAIEINLGTSYRIAFKTDIASEYQPYIKVLSNEFFNNNTSMYDTYLSNGYDTEFMFVSDAYGLINNVNTLMNSSLKSNNLTYRDIYYYTNNNSIYIESIIRVNNLNGVKKYNNKYLIPLHVKVQYKDMNSCVIDIADNSSSYSNYEIIESKDTSVTLYRSYTEKKEYKWSTSKTLNGYTATGKTEYR